MKTIQANLRTLLLLLLCLLPELKLVSQEIRNNSISGIVVDAESDSPLSEIKIYVFSNKETILTLTSDKNGAFQMSLPDGRYTIWLKDKVFLAKIITIEVRGDVNLGTIRMQKASDISSAGAINIRSEKKKDTPRS